MNINDLVEEQQRQLGDINHRISNIKINYSGNKTNRFILDHLTKSIQESKDFRQFSMNLLGFQDNMKSLKIFNQVKISLEKGKQQDQIEMGIDLKQKHRFFMSAKNMFGKDGSANVEVRGGLQNYLGFMEKTSLEYENSIGKKNQLIKFNIHFPVLPFFSLDNNIDFNYSIQKKQFYETNSWKYYQNLETKELLLNGQKYSCQLQSQKRMNKNVEDIKPSVKHSIQLNQQLVNNIFLSYNGFIGEFRQRNIEMTLPTSQVQFMKVNYLNRGYFRFGLFRLFSRRLYENTQIERNHDWGILLSNQKYSRINDRFIGSNLRGFKSISDFSDLSQEQGNYLSIKNSFKLLFLNHRIFKENINLIPYLHLSTLSSENLNRIRASGGFGLGYEVGQQMRIEVNYNLWYHKQQNDQTDNIQIRLSFND